MRRALFRFGVALDFGRLWVGQSEMTQIRNVAHGGEGDWYRVIFPRTNRPSLHRVFEAVRFREAIEVHVRYVTKGI